MYRCQSQFPDSSHTLPFPLGIHTREYDSAKRRKNIESFVETWIDLETVIQSEVSQTEKNTYCISTHVCGIQKNGTGALIGKSEIETDIDHNSFLKQFFIFSCVGSSLLRRHFLCYGEQGLREHRAGFSLWWFLLLRSSGCTVWV